MICTSLAAIGLSIFSVHLNKDPTKEYNEINPGIHIECDSGTVAGFYRNTFSKPSLYLGYHYSWSKYLGIQAQVTTGYSETLKVPIVAALTFYPIENLRFYIAPGGKHSTVIYTAVFLKKF